MNQITILFVEDHQLVREAVRDFLHEHPGFTVIGETDDGLEALRLAEKLQPRVVLLDLSIPGLNGLEVTRRLRQNFPQMHVVVVSGHAEADHVVQAFRSGAAAYVLKGSPLDHLVSAIHEVLAGHRFVSPPLSPQLIETALRQPPNAPSDLYDTLTTREREVFQLVAEGLTSAEVARRLSISPRTVEIHRANLMRKLKLRTLSDLVRYAIGRRVLPNDGSVTLKP